MASAAGGKQKSSCPPLWTPQHCASFPSPPTDQHFGKWGPWQPLQKFFLVFNRSSLGGHQRLGKEKKKGKSKAESSCPNESGWEEMSRGQGRERDLSGRAKMPAHRTRHAGNQNLRWEWAGLAGTKDEREVVTAWNTHTHH